MGGGESLKRLIILLVLMTTLLSGISFNVSQGKSYSLTRNEDIITVQSDIHQSNDDGGVRG